MGETRSLTRTQLREYLGSIPWAEVERLMDRGRIPGPMWGLEPGDKAARWDRRAVDKYMDVASGMPSTVEDAVLDMDRAFGFR